MKKASLFRDMKRRGEKIVVLTAYDAPTARIEVEAGVDVILIGDSVGVNILGYAHERDVTLGDMAHHVAAVRRGAPTAYLIADLPYATYDTPQQAQDSARRLTEAGANCAKFEGARPEIVVALKDAGIDVCCHIGLESQHQDVKRRQGKTAEAAERLLADARALDVAGQDFLVLELIPTEVAARIAESVSAPTIGIGAGPHVDGQVLVVNDMAGVTLREYRHNHRYAAIGATLKAAIADYAADVRSGRFPAAEHGFHMAPEERAVFERE